MANLSDNYNAIRHTPLENKQTIEEMFTILNALKYKISNDPNVSSWSSEVTMYDSYKKMISEGVLQLRDDADRRIETANQHETGGSLITTRRNKADKDAA